MYDLQMNLSRAIWFVSRKEWTARSLCLVDQSSNWLSNIVILVDYEKVSKPRLNRVFQGHTEIGHRVINSLISYNRLEINLSFLHGLMIVFLKSILVLLLSFLMPVFLTIVAMYFSSAQQEICYLYSCGKWF